MSVAMKSFYFEDGSVLDEQEVEEQKRSGLAVMICEEYEEASRVLLKEGTPVAWGRAGFDPNLNDKSREFPERTNVSGDWAYLEDIKEGLRQPNSKTWQDVKLAGFGRYRNHWFLPAGWDS